MINTEDLEYISKEELIERYMDLIHDYEEVVEHNDRLYVENSELNDDLNMPAAKLLFCKEQTLPDFISIIR